MLCKRNMFILLSVLFCFCIKFFNETKEKIVFIFQTLLSFIYYEDNCIKTCFEICIINSQNMKWNQIWNSLYFRNFIEIFTGILFFYFLNTFIFPNVWFCCPCKNLLKKILRSVSKRNIFSLHFISCIGSFNIKKSSYGTNFL